LGGGGSFDKEQEMKRFERMADGNAHAYPKGGGGGAVGGSTGGAYDSSLYNNNFGHQTRQGDFL